MCFFCNNQYRFSDDVDDLDIVFKERLRSCGRMVAMIDCWNGKVQYTTRIWTIFEQYTAHKELPEQNTHMILPPEEECTFEKALTTNGLEAVFSGFSDIRSRDAKAWSQEDEDKVKGIIESDIGFDVVDTRVKTLLKEWVGKRYECAIRSMKV